MAPPQPYPAAGVPSASAAPNGLMQQQPSLWRRWLPTRGKDSSIDDGPSEPAHKGLDFNHFQHQQQHQHQPDDTKTGVIRRVSRAVVPGLPRTQTFKRQRSEVRSKLEAVRPTPAERRAVSMDRRVHPSVSALNHADPRASAPDFLNRHLSAPSSPPSPPMSPPESVPDLYMGSLDDHLDDDHLDGTDAYDHLDRDSTGGGGGGGYFGHGHGHGTDTLSRADLQSMTTSQYDDMIEGELERKWILNLSMHFRDKSKREKFFVTFRQHDHHWRRVTISLDYRAAQEGSLEAELARAQYQREKSAKIYEAIRESLAEIDFYNTVTNLKLETKDGRLHVHVVEDTNEIICYPPVRTVEHMGCRRVKEREIHFDSHMSGFVYKVRVHGRLLIKKEIPGPDSVDEFLYEINALNQLFPSRHVIEFYGVVVDDHDQNVTGLLISYAAHGALIDAIYDRKDSLPWATREKWARQIVAGLSEIHEAGFVQGDFTLSNIVVDDKDDAKIIDINRRGCPIGWEPPEVTPLVDSSQRISMYIGVKSDLYQLGMVLWALAALDDEPEAHARPLEIDAASEAPGWYRRIVSTCLSPNPRNRAQAVQLLSWFPDPYEVGSQHGYAVSVDGGNSRSGYRSPTTTTGVPRVMTVHPPSDWAYVTWNGHNNNSNSNNPGGAAAGGDDSFYHPSRGRSPPSPMPSHLGDGYGQRMAGMQQTWSDVYNHHHHHHHHRAPTVPSVSDVLARGESESRGGETYADARYGARYGTETSADEEEEDEEEEEEEDVYSVAERGRSPPYRTPAAAVSAGGEVQSPPGGGFSLARAESHPDSGKDLTEQTASTPRDCRSPVGGGAVVVGEEEEARRRRRRRLGRSVSRGRSGRSSGASSSSSSLRGPQSPLPPAPPSPPLLPVDEPAGAPVPGELALTPEGFDAPAAAAEVTPPVEASRAPAESSPLAEPSSAPAESSPHADSSTSPHVESSSSAPAPANLTPPTPTPAAESSSAPIPAPVPAPAPIPPPSYRRTDENDLKGIGLAPGLALHRPPTVELDENEGEDGEEEEEDVLGMGVGRELDVRLREALAF